MWKQQIKEEREKVLAELDVIVDKCVNDPKRLKHMLMSMSGEIIEFRNVYKRERVYVWVVSALLIVDFMFLRR